MKIFALLCASLCFISFIRTSSGQNYDSSWNNYYFYTEKMDLWFDSIIAITPDTIKIPGLRDYERFKDFWSIRIHNYNNYQGNYFKYIEQIDLYTANPSMLPLNNTTNTWEFVGPNDLQTHNQGIVVSLYTDPNNLDNIYAGTNASGMYKTTNGGQIWTNVTDIILSPGIGVLDVEVDPTNTSVVYISTGNDFNNYGTGIYKSTDGCNSWERILSFNPEERKLARRLLIDPENTSILFALVNKYVYRTMDGGENWEIIFNQLTIPGWWDKNKYLIDIEFKPNDHNTIYISSVSIKTNENPTSDYSAEIWRTHNAKEMNVLWYKIDNGLPVYCERYELAATNYSPNLLYVQFTQGIEDYLLL